MSDLISTATSPNSCSHFVLGGLDDGAAWSGLQVHDTELLEPLTDEEKLTLRRLLLRKLRQRTGVGSIAAMIGRVVRGSEHTNMKVYNLIGPGAAIPKNNIGTAYVNISPGANGERSLVGFQGTEYRIFVHANLVGSGPFGVRIVRDSDDAVLYENASIAQTGEKELDTGFVPIPAAAIGQDVVVRVQAKSATAADDPVFRGVKVVVQ